MYVLAALGVILFYIFSLVYPRSSVMLLLSGIALYLSESWLVMIALVPFIFFSHLMDCWSIQYMKMGLEVEEAEDEDDHTPSRLA